MVDVAVPGLAIAPEPSVLRDQIAAWVTSPALRRALEAFGGPSLNAGNKADLDVLVAWTSTHWDFRAGRERNLLDPDIIDGDLEALVFASARDLGLVDPQPPVSHRYDHVLILGGLVRACIWRPEYAAHLVSHGISAGSIAAITGFRALSPDERALLSAFDLPEMDNEFNVVEAALRQCFPVDALTTVAESAPDAPDNARYRVATGTTLDGLPISLSVAPSAEPGTRRANTADGYRFWAEQIANVTTGTRVLLVTSQIYVPFQHADAVRMLGISHGCVLETVGIDHTYVDSRSVPQVFRGVNYLQEMNSSVRSFRMLLEALPDV